MEISKKKFLFFFRNDESLFLSFINLLSIVNTIDPNMVISFDNKSLYVMSNDNKYKYFQIKYHQDYYRILLINTNLWVIFYTDNSSSISIELEQQVSNLKKSSNGKFRDFLSKLYSKSKITKEVHESIRVINDVNENELKPIKTINKINDVENFLLSIKELLAKNKYISKKEYLFLLEQVRNEYNLLSNLKTAELLDHYCLKNNIDIINYCCKGQISC